MADAKVNIIVSATDKASGVFKGILGSLKSIGEFALGGIVGDVLGDALRGAVNAIPDMVGKASDLSETINKVGVVFGDAGQEIIAFSEDSAVAFGQSQQAMLDASATFGIFGKSAGLTGSDLADFSTDLAGLASDIASFNNASPEEVVTALGAALRGESEPMRRFGVLLDDATLRQKALELGIVSTTKDALTPQQKILAANAVIWEQTADAQGDFARTSDGLANQQRILNASLENVKTTLGTALLPVINTFAGVLVDFVSSEQFTEFLDNAVVFLQDVAAWLGDFLPVAIAKAKEWFEAIQPTLQAVWQWIAQNLPPAIAALAAFWANVLQPALQAVWQFIQANVIPILIKVWEWIGTHLPPVIQALANFWTNVLQPALNKVWQFLTVDMLPIWQAIGEYLSVTIPLAIDILKGVWQNILLPILKAVWGFIRDNILPIFKAWSDSIGGISGAIQTVVGWIQKLTDKLRNIQLPDWLTPGSPTPFELGLRGIADAMKDVNGMTAAVNFTPAGLAYANAGATTNNYYNMTVNQAGRVVDTSGKFAMMRGRL